METNTNNTDTTEIAFILDRSGSMHDLAEAAIAGFNQFLRDQRASEGTARLSLILFDDRYEVPFDNTRLDKVLELDTSTFVPRGTTALLDAIGTTITNFKKRHKALPKTERPEKVIFAIFTDGLENASREYTWPRIAEMIEKRRKKNKWEFLFLGANQDAIATAAQLNIHANDAATFTCSAKGVSGSTRAFNRKINALRSKPPMDTSARPKDLDKPMSDILHEEEAK